MGPLANTTDAKLCEGVGMDKTTDLNGAHTEALALFRSLPAGYESHVVRNGTLIFAEAAPAKSDQFEFDLTIEDCDIRNPGKAKRGITAARFRSLTIRDSTIEHDFVFDRCTFAGDFSIEIVELRGTLDLRSCTFESGLPILYRVWSK